MDDIEKAKKNGLKNMSTQTDQCLTNGGKMMFENNVTIMKYKTPNNEYKFEVMDKFDEPDEAIRLDKMLALADKLESEGKLAERLWIKNTPII